MSSLIEQLIDKMGLRDEVGVLQKTTELLRLLELRTVKMPLQLNEYGKIVLCADIAAGLLSIAFDQEQALKLSGLRKSHYKNHKRMFEKLLDLQRIVGIRDICIQLGVNELWLKAQELLELYTRVMTADRDDIDTAHPQYAAMAVFYAAKLLKKKLVKTKLMPLSNLRPTQWQDLEQRWGKFLAKHYRNSLDAAKKSQSTEIHETAKHFSAKKANVEGGSTRAADSEDYEKWKSRMLSLAEAQLKRQQSDQHQMEKENMSVEL